MCGFALTGRRLVSPLRRTAVGPDHATSPSHSADRAAGRLVRIAWLGPTPTEYAGVPYVAYQMLRELARAGVSVDCYLVASPDELPPALVAEPGIHFFCEESRWEYGRWYSRGPMFRFFSGNLAQAWTQLRLTTRIAARHKEQPYDLVYQLSQPELLSLRWRRRSLPPIVVHPETHAGGELAWHRRESPLAKRCEPFLKRAVVRAMLTARAALQSSDLKVASRVVAVSSRFAEHLAHDYDLASDRLGVVPNTVDIERFVPAAGPRDGEALELLFVSRMSCRKGVDLVVALSHRLNDLAGRVQVRAIGGPTTWSDYRPLLADLNPAIATHVEEVTPEDLVKLFASADGVLQPSQFDPCPITVLEALASGLPVVASDEVGSTEGVDPGVCSVFPAGDLAAFESAVRELVARLEQGEGAQMQKIARAEAERLFAPPRVAAKLVEEFERVLGKPATPPRDVAA